VCNAYEDNNKPTTASRRAEFDKALRGARDSAGLISILGPRDVTEQVRAVLAAVADLMERVTDPPDDPADVGKTAPDTFEYRRYSLASVRFTKEAQAALGIKDA
jgi:hypothetical protein